MHVIHACHMLSKAGQMHEAACNCHRLLMQVSCVLQHGQHPSSNGGWAKGTGYGGPGSYYGMQHQVDQEEQESRKAAGQRQQVVDEHLQRGITAICNCLEQATGTYT